MRESEEMISEDFLKRKDFYSDCFAARPSKGKMVILPFVLRYRTFVSRYDLKNSPKFFMSFFE